ncbi:MULTISPECIES: hypothetical protein [Caproicibacterium]|uniref:Uncharacterized protein n=1 Tax=Caproicibacterium argilliputei TaxID=3030016 RepID=A0AA97D7J7_9FIRM|nr:hypothetical protein [Caproicibacterium argilliputei]WOC32015.1 hypothetical protein PXC00_12595 [Caproicibacterium argilliputei]
MKSKLAWAAFGVTLAVSLGLRAVQLAAAETFGAWGIALCGVLAAGALVCLLACRSDHTMVRLPVSGRLLSTAYTLTGILLTGVSVVYQAWNKTGKFPYTTGICTVLAVAAGLMLCLEGCLFAADGQNYFADHPVLALTPTLWCCAELVLQFRVNASEPVSTENILRTGALLFLMLTLQALVQMDTEVRRVSRGRLFGLTFATVLFAAASALPRFGNAEAAAYPPGLLWVLPVMGAFLMIAVCTVRPMTREELTGETEDEEVPEVRPVVMKDAPTLTARRSRGNRPVIASREDRRPLSPNEMEKRLERVLIQYLGQKYNAKCYFYTHKKPH